MDQRNHRRGRYQCKPPAEAGDNQRRQQEIQKPQYQICLPLLRHYYPGNPRGERNLRGLRRAFRTGIKIKGGGREASAKLCIYFLAENFSASAYIQRCSNSKSIIPAAGQQVGKRRFASVIVKFIQ